MKLSVLKIPGRENALRIVVEGWKARADPVRYTLRTDGPEGTVARERAIPRERIIEKGVLSFEAADIGVAYESGFADARIDITDDAGRQHAGGGRAEPPGHLDGSTRSAFPAARPQIGADIAVSGHGDSVQVDPLGVNAVSAADYAVVLAPGSGARVAGPPADPRVTVPIRRGADSTAAYRLEPREGGSPIAGTITASHRRGALTGAYLMGLPLLLLVGMAASLLHDPTEGPGGGPGGGSGGGPADFRGTARIAFGGTGVAEFDAGFPALLRKGWRFEPVDPAAYPEGIARVDLVGGRAVEIGVDGRAGPLDPLGLTLRNGGETRAGVVDVEILEPDFALRTLRIAVPQSEARRVPLSDFYTRSGAGVVDPRDVTVSVVDPSAHAGTLAFSYPPGAMEITATGAPRTVRVGIKLEHAASGIAPLGGVMRVDITPPPPTCTLSGIPARHGLQLDMAGRARLPSATLLPGISDADRKAVTHRVLGGADVTLRRSGGDAWQVTAREPYARQVQVAFDCPGAASRTVTFTLTPPDMPRCTLPQREIRVRMPAMQGDLVLSDLVPDVDPSRYRELRFASVRRGDAAFSSPKNGKIRVRVAPGLNEVGFRIECEGKAANGVLEIVPPPPPLTDHCVAGDPARRTDMIYRTAFHLPEGLYRFSGVGNARLREAIETAAGQVQPRGAFEPDGVRLDKSYCVMRETLRMRDLVALIGKGVVGISPEELKRRTRENAPGSSDSPASQMSYAPDVENIVEHVASRGGGLGIDGVDVVSREVWFASLILLARTGDEALYRDFFDGVPEFLNSGPNINDLRYTIFGQKPQGDRGYEINSRNSSKRSAVPVQLRLMWDE